MPRHAAALLLALALAMACALPARTQTAEPTADPAPVLQAVRSRGELVCGVDAGQAGFSARDAQGQWQGLDVDICRALAAAVLGSAERVQFVPLATSERFGRLRAGNVDVLARHTAITLERDAALGLQMTAIVYYDGLHFMVPLQSRIRSARQLRRKTVCLPRDAATERSVLAYARQHRLDITPRVFDHPLALANAYFSGQCDALADEASQLAAWRAEHARTPADHLIVPELLAKSPMGPLVRRGDEHWAALVRWLVYGLIEAEEAGITQANVETQRDSADPVLRRLVGTHEDIGKPLGLDREWLARAVRASGNYGEIVDRHLGPSSPLALPRGLNHLWNQGGLQYAPPLR